MPARRRHRRRRQWLPVALDQFESTSGPRAARKVLASREATALLHSTAARTVASKHVTRAAAARGQGQLRPNAPSSSAGER